MQTEQKSKSAEFYDRLMEGKETRGILGKDQRFNAARIAASPSIQTYFVDVVRPFLTGNEKVLDFGCGPGSFVSAIAKYCGHITGMDITKSFVDECQRVIQAQGLTNASAVHIPIGMKLPFEDGHFSVVILVDVIHHLENVDEALSEVFRVLHRGGRLIIFEPNKLNPLIALIHALDKNEWGLLKVGSFGQYKKILEKKIDLDTFDYNGIVIGPESPIFHHASAVLNHPAIKPVLGWLNPKMIISGKKY